MTHPYIHYAQCTLCGTQYDLDTITYTCPRCGQMGTLDIIYDFEKLRGLHRPHAYSSGDPIEASNTGLTMWRYRPILPILEDQFIPPLPVGGTPLIPAPRLASALGIRELWLKDDGRNPTGSLKDRASAMVVARALELNAPVITTASTGNAAAALAGICASVAKKAVIFVPASAPAAKIAQLLVYGATVFLVQGTYDQAFDLCVQAANEYGWYCRNTGMNPYTTEGKKTAAMEIAEQLGWDVPDAVVVSVGDGSIIGGQHKGFRDLQSLGWIDRVPRLIGVQAEGSQALVKAWREGLDPATMPPQPANTIADSISASVPRDGVKAIRAVKDTGGVYVSVTDQAILDSIPELARATGVFVEPACAATLAGLHQAIQTGAIRSQDRVVLLLTGTGLKDVSAAMRSVGASNGQAASMGYRVDPEIGAVRQLIEELALT